MNPKAKTALIWVVLLAVVFLVLYARDSKPAATQISAAAALKLLDAKQVISYGIHGDELLLDTNQGFTVAVHPPVSAQVWQSLTDSGALYVPKAESSPVTDILPTVLIVALAIGALIYFLRRFQNKATGNIFELRKTKARPVADADKAKFTDIGGNRAAVELVADIVDFLKAPQRWTSVGLRVPRGVLIVGPPGTGKTLLARAVAGETNAAYFYASAAEFVEMFVGVGAARVRDTFEKAVAKQPAVIFLDEIDAIGRRRGSGVGAMHEEREQTLNQLLVLLDGMEKHTRLVVIAATNRPDVLDPALLRSGRFDRTLKLELPTAAERAEILKIHLRGKPVSSTISLERIVAATPDFSGADLESLCNSAGLLALRRTRTATNGDQQSIAIVQEDFARAIEEMTKSNRLFDRLDSVLVESASQFAEPIGRAVAKITLVNGNVLEGEVLWMNATHIKLRLDDKSEVIVDKKSAVQISAMKGTELAPEADFKPDRLVGRNLQTG